jgi:phospholipase/carboxylesterase
MSRDRIIELVLGVTVVALASVIVHHELSAPLEPPSHPIAAAIMSEEGELSAWPPLGPELAHHRSATHDASHAHDGGHDAGTDMGDFDAGPPLPALPPDSATFHVRDEERDGIYYLEVVIGEADFDDELPMIVVLHGRGGRAQIPGGPFLGLTHPVRVIVPQATEPLGSGFEWLPVYVGQGLVDRLSSTLFAQASRIAELVRELRRHRPTTGRTIVTGFSQGSLLTITLALYHDDLFGAAFPLASWLPPPLVPAYRRRDLSYPPIRSMHGTADPTIPFEPTRELYAQLRDLGFDVTFVPFAGVVHTISDAENALFHEWLDAAVCDVVMDDDCADAAEARAAAMLPADSMFSDAGADDDAGVDAFVVDAIVDDAGPTGTGCTTDADCVVTAPLDATCCPTCEEIAANRAWVAARDVRCDASGCGLGCGRRAGRSAVCVAGQCELHIEPVHQP